MVAEVEEARVESCLLPVWYEMCLEDEEEGKMEELPGRRGGY